MTSRPGVWRALDGSDAFTPKFSVAGYDDVDWTDLPNTQTADTQSRPAALRAEFETPPSMEGRRLWLEIGGDYGQAEVWLDGQYTGEIDRIPVKHSIEIVDRGTTHALALELNGQSTNAWTGARNSDPLSTEPLQVVETGTMRITRMKAMCTDATPDRALLAVNAEIDSESSGMARIRTTLKNCSSGAVVQVNETTRGVAAGPNRVGWTLTLEHPQLWWPRALGEPCLHDVVVEVFDLSHGEKSSDERRFEAGLRVTTVEQWKTMVNGESLFVKGLLVSAREIRDGKAGRGLVDEALVAGLDLIVLSDGVANDEFYSAAGSSGLLIWQQLPGRARNEKARARHERISRQTIEWLAHRPAISCWTLDHQMPSALPGFLERNRRMIERSDPSRPVVHSPRSHPPLVAQKVLPPPRLPIVHVDSHDEIASIRRRKYQPFTGLLLEGEIAYVGDTVTATAATAGPTRRESSGLSTVEVHVVNDTRASYPRSIVTATLTGGHEPLIWEWEGDADPDCCIHVGTMVVPSSFRGSSVRIELKWSDASGEHATVTTTERTF